jgi:hypothetical protein
MKKHWQVVLVAIAIVIAGWHVGQAQSQIAKFQIVVEPTTTGFKAVCLSGCAWKELTYGCDRSGGTSCKAEIDQLGVGTAPK